jgi:transposase
MKNTPNSVKMQPRKVNPKRQPAPGVPVRTIGIDLGFERSAFCELNQAGEVVAEDWVLTTRETLRAQWEQAPVKGRVVIEACGLSSWVGEEFVAMGYELVVANPAKVPLIGSNHRKNDQTDAYLLAKLGRADVELLAPVQPLGTDAHLARSTVRLRRLAIEARVKLINAARGLGRTMGCPIPAGKADDFTVRARQHLMAKGGMGLEVLKMLEPLLLGIEGLEATERRYDVMLQKLQQQPEYSAAKLLQTVPAVGIVTAMTYILTIGDPHRFSNSRDVAAFIGLTPARKQSGASDPQLNISKAGDGYLRSLLVECAHRLLQDRSPTCALRNWGRELAKRGGKRGKRKAVVAVARKLAVILHRLWLTGQPFAAYPQLAPEAGVTN